MNNENDKFFNSSREDILDMQKSIENWVDDNHPRISKANGGKFSNVLREGRENFSKSKIKDVFKDI